MELPTDVSAYLAEAIDAGVDPIPRYLIQRDLLETSASELRSSRAGRDASRWTEQIEASQWADGSWGRFHTQNTKRKQTIPTTELAIRMALESGLARDDPVMKSTIGYIERVLRDELDWRDWREKHDSPDAWPFHVRNISAANLAMIDPQHRLLADHRAFWVQVADAAFGAGRYDREAEGAAFNDVTGFGVKNPPRVGQRYSLTLLSTGRDLLAPKVEKALTRQVLSAMPPPDPDTLSSISSSRESGRAVYRWLLDSRPAFGLPSWRTAVGRIADRLTGATDGLFDLGSKLPRRPYSGFPLSESWRKKANREIDSTVWVWRQVRAIRAADGYGS